MTGQTQAAIRRAFMQLLEQRPFNEITVKLIVETCGINRKTFYNHYRDIPDLMEKIITDEAETIMARYPSSDSIEDCLYAALEFALQHRQAALHIYRSVGRDFYTENLLKLCDFLVRGYMGRVAGSAGMDPKDREILIGLYRGQLFGLITEWMMQGMQSDILNDFHRVCQLRAGMIEELIQRSRKTPQTP